MLKLSIAKKIIIALVIILSSSANAQLDRSIMPESVLLQKYFLENLKHLS